MVSRLARASGARALSIDYRLAPESPFPAPVEDALDAYRWLLSEGADPGKIVIGGDSAGGGLTVASLVAMRYLGDPLPAAGVCISPWVDLEGTGESITKNAALDPMGGRSMMKNMTKWYIGDMDPKTPLAAPLYADLHGLLLIQVGSPEMLLDDSTRLAERAKAAGVDVKLEVWEDVFHVWQYFASILPEGQQAIDRIGEFVRQHTS